MSKKNMGMYFHVFPISIFLHEIVFLHGKFIAVSQASTLDQYLANEDWSCDRVSSIYI